MIISKHSPQVATLIVAASDSLSKIGAAYICDGTDDHVQIQAAIDALPSTGGKVLLLEGTFTLGATVTIAKNGVTLEGQGKGTIVTLAASKDVNLITFGDNANQYYRTTISDIYFDGNQANQTTAGTILWNQQANYTTEYVLIKDCYFVNSYDNAINFDGRGAGGGSAQRHQMVQNCIFENWKAGKSAYRESMGGMVVGCQFNQDQTTGTAISGSSRTLIFGCKFTVPNSYNDSLVSGGDVIQNCYFVAGSSIGSSAKLVIGVYNVIGNDFSIGASANAASAVIYQGYVVQNNQIAGGGIGIYMDNYYETVTGNLLWNTKAEAIKCPYDGYATISNNTFRSCCQGTNDTYAVIDVSNAEYMNISGNTMSSNNANKPKYGIYASAGGPFIVTNNVVKNTVTDTILVTDASSIVANNLDV